MLLVTALKLLISSVLNTMVVSSFSSIVLMPSPRIAKIEKNRLDDLRDPKIQHKLRATSYNKLNAHLQYRAQSLEEQGKMYCLANPLYYHQDLLAGLDT